MSIFLVAHPWHKNIPYLKELFVTWIYVFSYVDMNAQEFDF